MALSICGRVELPMYKRLTQELYIPMEVIKAQHLLNAVVANISFQVHAMQRIV